MRLSHDRRGLGRVAAVLGILQGAAWSIMSLAAIILYNWDFTPGEITTYGKLLEACIYATFLQGPIGSSQFIVRPEDFTIIMWIYFLLSVGWFAVSADLFSAIHTNKERQTTIMIIWGSVTFLVSLIDLIFVCLLGRDYSTCNESWDMTQIASHYCFLTVGIVMSIAARGFTLWFVNVIFAFIVIYVSANTIKEENSFGSLYSCHSIPRVKIPKSESSINNNYFSRNSDTNSVPVSSPSLFQTTPTYPTNEPPLPSFLSRGDKFSY